jgi:acetoin utilization protein AcuB
MHVGRFMTRDPITVSEDVSVKDAMLLLRTHKIRHLPVADGKQLVGPVSDRDIRRASPSLLSGIGKDDYEQILDDTKVARIMTREPFTVTENTTVEEAVGVLVERKFGSLPVVEGTDLVGIFTEIDALKVLLKHLGGTLNAEPESKIG